MSDDLKAELGMADEADLAQLRGIKIEALRNERSKGLGPPWVKIGKKILYPIAGLKADIAKQMVVPGKPNTLIDGRGKSAKRK